MIIQSDPRPCSRARSCLVLPIFCWSPVLAGPSLFTTLLFTVLITAWGGNYTFVKVALRDSGPWTFNALRYTLAALVLGGVLWAGRGWRALVPLRGERLRLAVIGFLQTAVVTGGSTLALARIDASRTVLIVYSMPVWAALLSFALGRDRPTPAVLAGVGASFTGLTLLSSPWAIDWTSAPVAIGSLFALAGTIGWALGAVLYRERKWRSEIWCQVVWQLWVAAGTTSLAALALETTRFTPTTLYGAITVYNALIPTVVAYWCWFRVLERMSATRASQLLMLSPLFGVLLSHVLLQEPLSLTLLASAFLVVAGAILSYSGTAARTATNDAA